MTSLRRVAVLALSVPLLLSGAACGGDDDDGSAGGERLSKEEFITQGDAICTELNSASDKISTEGEDLDSLVKFLDQIIAVVEKARDDIAALNPPKDGADVQKALIKGLEAGVSASQDAQEAARKNDQEAVAASLKAIQTAGEDIKTSTADYGFKVCSESG